jgi:hypothetical protein
MCVYICIHIYVLHVMEMHSYVHAEKHGRARHGACPYVCACVSLYYTSTYTKHDGNAFMHTGSRSMDVALVVAVQIDDSYFGSSR